MRTNSHEPSPVGPGRPGPGVLLVIGGAEDRTGDCVLLRDFTELAGGAEARIVLITAASGAPADSFAEYASVFRRLGVPDVRELRIGGQDQANGERTGAELAAATGVFLTGGDQARLGPLVGSRTNRVLRDRLSASTLAVAGTSAGATALGPEMILGGLGRAGNRLRTGPGLGLLPGVIVDMHFAQRRRLPRLVGAVRRRPSHLGIGIDEDTAIRVRHGRFVVLGRGEVVTVDARPPGARLHWLGAGDAFDLRNLHPIR
ncbi:MAG TPA: cyanophycinase [Streptosporangiaceae bacterium]|nr:cyanophycinase [Streptosporangiaceae bacterium]